MQLAQLQRALAASLAGRGAPPAGCGAAAVERARRALVAKRRRTVRRLLPRTAAALLDGWEECFRRHAGRYAPSGLLQHVDDAWELAVHLAAAARRTGGAFAVSSPVGAAAHADLVELRLRYARGRRPGSWRIRERRGPLLAWTPLPRRTLVIRLPGREGQVWRWPVGWPSR